MIAFLIIAHTDPAQLRRLILALRTSETRFYVHLDLKSAIEPFRAALSDFPDVNFIEDRIKVYWGGWSQVEATLNLIRAAVVVEPAAQRFVLLSGACYPIKSSAMLRGFLFSDRSEHISSIPLPNKKAHKPLSRLNRRYIEGGSRVPGLTAFCIKVLNKLALLVPPRRIKDGLGGFSPYAGRQWWALTRDAIVTILATVAERPALVALFKHSKCPDEMFFQTILSNSRFSSTIRTSLTYVDRSDPKEFPALIKERHMAQLLDPEYRHSDLFGTGPIFFARKFSSKHVNVLDKIDAARL